MVGHIQRTEAILQNAGYNVHHKVVNGEPEEVVSEYVERHGIHMVVMGAYGHSAIRHLLIGSTTTNLVRRCYIPILMFR
jgi:nucleotide-binding universal stress UspA family protein